MTPTDPLEDFLRTGQLGMLRVGMAHADVLAGLGPAEASIDDVDPVYRYADVEVYVDGGRGQVWMIQLEPFEATAGLPPALGVGNSLGLPPDRQAFVHYLDERRIDYRSGEFHVPGQEELMIRSSRVTVFFFEDGSLSSLAVVGSRPEHRQD